MTDQERELVERIAVALEKIAAKPVVLPSGFVWDETRKVWALPDDYKEHR